MLSKKLKMLLIRSTNPAAPTLWHWHVPGRKSMRGGGNNLAGSYAKGKIFDVNHIVILRLHAYDRSTSIGSVFSQHDFVDTVCLTCPAVSFNESIPACTEATASQDRSSLERFFKKVPSPGLYYSMMSRDAAARRGLVSLPDASSPSETKHFK